jgi:hypothetical protein
MAVRYKFDKDFDFPVRTEQGHVQAIVAYKSGAEHLIPDAHAEKADSAGAGQRLDRGRQRVASAEGPQDAYNAGSDNAQV